MTNQISQLLDIFREGRAALAKDVQALEVSRDIGREIFGACLLCRITTNLLGIEILHRHELVTEASTVLRSCMESVFWLGAISRDTGFIDKIVKQDNQSRKSLAKNVLKHPLHLAELDVSTIREIRKRGENSAPEGGLGRLVILDAATAAGLESFYPVYLSLSNQSAHPSAASLQKHVTFDQHGELNAIDCTPRNDADWLETISLAGALVFHTCFFLERFSLTKGSLGQISCGRKTKPQRILVTNSTSVAMSHCGPFGSHGRLLRRCL